MGQKVYSLKDLEKTLHIKAQTLRTWEKRYGLICPNRDKSNCRCYTEDEKDLLSNILLLKKNGFKLKKLAKWDKQRIKEEAKNIVLNDQLADRWLEEILEATISFNKPEIERVFKQIKSHYDFDHMIHRGFLPLFNQFSLLWLTGSVHALHEKFLGQLVYNQIVLEVETLKERINASHKKVLLFSPDSAQKEYLVKIIHYFLKKCQYQVQYFGCNISPNQIPPILKHLTIDELYILISEDFIAVEIDQWIEHLKQIFPALNIHIISHPPLKHRPKIDGQIHFYQGIEEFSKIVQ